MIWTIVLTALATLAAIVLAMNFATPEKKLERKIEHRYAVNDPQFEREMSVMLGPSIMPGNQVEDLENGVQIFPAMLEAIHAARRNINFDHAFISWIYRLNLFKGAFGGSLIFKILNRHIVCGDESAFCADLCGHVWKHNAFVHG